MKREAIRRKLEEIYTERGVADPEKAARQMLSDVREYAGLLLERGPGEYGFIHLTFQEYLGAVAIAQRGQREVGPVIKVLANHVGDDNWHEVALLTVSYMGIIQQRDEAAAEVVELTIPEKHVTCEFVEGDSLDEKVEAFATRIAAVMSALS